MRGVLAAGVVAAVLAAVLVGGTPSSMADGAVDPMARAREAAESLHFAGDVRVRWVDHAGVAHTTELHVQGGDGVIRLGGGPSLLAATKEQRWLFRNGEWDLVSPAALPDGPPIDRKYDVASTAGPDVAGRTTTLVTLRAEGRTRERLYVDRDTGLLLQREQLGTDGQIVRTVSFVTFELDPAATPTKPGASVDHRPSRVQDVSAPYRAPARLAGGYERSAVLRRNGVVQVVYSDGVHTLSVFEQQGRLDKRSVPEGAQPVSVGSANGVRMVWAGGEVVMWEAGQSTFTAIGDGDAEEVMTAARSMPRPGGLSAWQRVRRACASIVEAIAG